MSEPNRDLIMKALERIQQHGDLFEPVLAEPRPLSAAAKKLERLGSGA